MSSKTRKVGVWMALGALVGALIGTVIGVFSQNWLWIAFGVPLGLALGFGIAAVRAFGVHTQKGKNATEHKN